MKLMKPEQIPQFVQDLVNLGCDICAIGDVGYVFGDADLSSEKADAIAPDLRRLKETYGSRSHLEREIIAYLKSIGRYVDLHGDIAMMRRH